MIGNFRCLKDIQGVDMAYIMSISYRLYESKLFRHHDENQKSVTMNYVLKITIEMKRKCQKVYFSSWSLFVRSESIQTEKEGVVPRVYSRVLLQEEQNCT